MILCWRCSLSGLSRNGAAARFSPARARSIVWSTHRPDQRGRYHKISHGPARLETLFVDLFLEAHAKPPKRIIILDATDDPLHGHQEERVFQSYYGCDCYLPLYIFCGRQQLAAKLRPPNIDASAGAREEIERIVARIRAC